MKTLGLITARGGSKGIPGKNLAPLGGRQLIEWTIAAAKSCAALDRLVLSSDDDAIMAAARAAGCDVSFVRPAALASDTATSVDVALHALDTLGEDYRYLVLLQPTSPFRDAADIAACVALCRERRAWSAVTVTSFEHSPWLAFQLSGDHRLVPLMAEVRNQRRQDLPAAVTLNGAVYVVDVEEFRRRRVFVDGDTVAHVMPRQRSLDIDEPFDLALAQAMVAAGMTAYPLPNADEK